MGFFTRCFIKHTNHNCCKLAICKWFSNKLVSVEMKNKAQKPERLLGTIRLYCCCLLLANLFAQPVTPIKGESFLLNGVYYSNIDILFVFNKEYQQALDSGLIFDIDLDFVIVNVTKKAFRPRNRQAKPEIYPEIQCLHPAIHHF